MKSQAFPKHGERASSEPPKPARPLEWRHIEALESLIDGGSTTQQRVLAGFFVFLIHTSHRCSDGQQSWKLKLTDVDLMGEALIKGKVSWTKCGLPRAKDSHEVIGRGHG